MDVLLDTLNVKLRGAWDEARVAGVIASCGGSLKRLLPGIGWFQAQIDHARASDLFLAYERHPDVERVDFAIPLKRTAVQAYHVGSADPFLADQYALWRMRIPQAWALIGKGNPAVKVGIVDDGLSLLPEFESRVVARESVVGSGLNSWDDHGNNVASTIAAADNGTGCVGIAPDVSLIGISVYAEGDDAGDDGAYSAGLLRAQELGACVLNLSSGFTAQQTPATYAAGTMLDDTMVTLASAGALCFFAGGNDGADEAEGWYGFPASLAHARGHVSVGATSYEAEDWPAPYSNYGATPSIVTPGHVNWTASGSSYSADPEFPANWTSPFGHAHTDAARTLTYDQIIFAGTSSATPEGTGVTALTWGVAPPGTAGAFTAAQMRDFLLSTVDKGQSDELYARFTRAGIGIPNALKMACKEKAYLVPNTVFPFVGWFGLGVKHTMAGGVPTTRLRGTVKVEASAYSANADHSYRTITNVKIYAGATLLYDGAPRTTWDSLLPLDLTPHVGQALRFVVTDSSDAVSDVTYSDITVEG